MPRQYHSPSSIALALRCRRAWAYRYIDGLRRPEITWEEIVAGAQPERWQRSPALGKAVHSVGEAYFGAPAERDAIDWSSVPGQIYHSGLAYLPRPSACSMIEPERAIGSVPIVARELGAPDRVLVVHGVRWAGFRDLVVCAPPSDAWAYPQLRTYRQSGLLLVDYKTTSSVAKWAKTAAELLADAQHALYTVDVCEAYGLSECASRWLYLQTGASRRAHPVDVEQSRDAALELLSPLADIARELDSIERSCDTELCLSACDDYGGCEHHSSNGGSCPAKLNPWAGIPIQAKRKEKIVPIDANMRKRFLVATSALAAIEAPPAEAPPAEAPPAEAPPAEAPPAEAPPAEAPPAEAPPAEAPPAEAPQPPAAPPAPRVLKPRRAARSPQPPAAPPPPQAIEPEPVAVPLDSELGRALASVCGLPATSPVARVIALQSDLAAAEARRLAAAAEVESLLALLREELA